MEDNYNKILEKVSSISGIERQEIDRRVEAKRAKLSGLISREGALQVISAELGISFDNEKLKIDELLQGMRKVNFTGKIITMYPIREYTTKTGDKGKVANIIVADDTSNIKIVLWDTNHIELLESDKIEIGTVIEVISGRMRDNEVHLGSFSEFKVSSEVFENVQTEKPVQEKTIDEFSPGDTVSTRAFIVQAFDPKFFEVNKETGRKMTEEDKAAGKEVERRSLINVMIDDGTENMRAVMFHENVGKIGVTEMDDEAVIKSQKEALLGKEFIFKGLIKRNSYFNNYELSVSDIEEVEIDKIIAELEAN